jgi:ubiquinone/menaquinone biosynthesis C-methylase UbiE
MSAGDRSSHAVEAWEELAAWYDEKMGDEGDLWHRTLIDPGLLQVLGPVRGLELLDLGCGNGYLCRRFAREGARVTGVDASAAVIERARQREARKPLGITYHVADAAALSVLGDASFDVVVSNMALMDIADAEGAIREASRVLRPGGRLVFSISHPCFDLPGGASAWVVERVDFTSTVWRKVRSYRELFVAPVPWRLEGDRLAYTPAYHRPLSWYVRTLRAAGFVVTALEEPAPTEEFLADSPQGPWIAEIPLHCVIEARTETSRLS